MTITALETAEPISYSLLLEKEKRRLESIEEILFTWHMIWCSIYSRATHSHHITLPLTHLKNIVTIALISLNAY